jgi:RNA polymerase sigma-70 factor (sigma-E family)
VAPWEKALDTFVRVRGPALIRYAFLLTGDRTAAEDLVQDALIKTFTRGRATNDIVFTEAYVRRALVTRAIDGFRSRRRFLAVRHLIATEPAQAGPEGATTTHVDLASALTALSPQQRACIVLRYYEDLTVPEIADRIGCALGTTKRYLSDALHALEKTLGPIAEKSTESVPLTLERSR